MARENEPVIWSVVRGSSPYSDAVEPGAAGVTIPDDVIARAEGNGAPDDTDVYVLVAPEDEAGEVTGEIDRWAGVLPAADVALIRAALNEKQEDRLESADRRLAGLAAEDEDEDT